MQLKFPKLSINSSPWEPGVTTIHSTIVWDLKKFIAENKSSSIWNWTFSKHLVYLSHSLVLFGSYQNTLKYLKFKFNSSSYFVSLGNVS